MKQARVALLVVGSILMLVTAGCAPPPSGGPLLAQTTTVLPMSLHLESDAGDWLGRGFVANLTPDDATFTASGDPSAVNITVDDGTSVPWSLTFASPTLTSPRDHLQPGPYTAATEYPLQSPTGAGLSIWGLGRSCDTVTGNFQVLEADYSGDGQIKRFAADFEQHCDGAAAAMRGFVTFDASSPFPTPEDSDGDGIPDTLDNCTVVANPAQSDADADTIGDDCDPTFEHVSLTFDSDPDDHVGQGIDATWHRTDDTYAANGTPTSAHVSFDAGLTYWNLDFEAPTPLAAGTTYAGATRYPFEDPSIPGLSVWGSGRGCETVNSTFTVNEIAFSDGALTQFSADFVQHCLGSSAALSGSVRFFSTSA